MTEETKKSAALAPAADDDPFQWVGHTLDGRYAVEALVGEGGFAVVYRGHHNGFDDAVAIKFLKIPRKLAGDDRERFLQQFLDEGKLLYRLSRGNASIVRSLDVGVATSPNGSWTPYLVLEWLDGKTLEDDLTARRRRKQAVRTLEEARALLEPAARALGTAHAQGVAHRDVKPANLFLCSVDGERTLKVLDFGIAKVIADSTDLRRAHEATGTSLQAFTPRYGAPEQFDRRFGATGPWTDVFALALILVELVIGRAAMQGEGVELFLTASNIQERPSLRTFGIDEGDAVENVLLRALAVQPKERYANANEFWDALAKAMGNAHSSAPPSRIDPLAQTVPSAREVASSARRGKRSVPSGRTPIAMVHTPVDSSIEEAARRRAAIRAPSVSMSERHGYGARSAIKNWAPWIGIVTVLVVCGTWGYKRFAEEENHYRGLSTRGRAAAASPELPASPIPPPSATVDAGPPRTSPPPP